MLWLRLSQRNQNTFGILWFKISDAMKCVCFLNKTISSQIASNSS